MRREINSPVMLSRDLLRDDPEKVRQGLLNRNTNPAPLDAWLLLDAERRAALGESEELKRQRNEASRAIGEIKKRGGDASAEIAAVGELKGRIEELEGRLQTIDPELLAIEHSLPNLPHESVPVGEDESANRCERDCRHPARIRLRAQGPLGPRAGARHPRLRARRQAHRRPLHRLLRRRRPARARPDQLHARPPHPRARLHRGPAAVPRQRPDALRHRPAPQVRAGPLQAGEAPLLPDPDRRGAGHQPLPRRDPRRVAACRSATPPTPPASAARRAPTARTCAA